MKVLKQNKSFGSIKIQNHHFLHQQSKIMECPVGMDKNSRGKPHLFYVLASFIFPSV